MNKRINELTSPFWAEGQEEADITSVLKLINNIETEYEYCLSNTFLQAFNDCWEFAWKEYKIGHKPLNLFTPQEIEDLLTLLEKLPRKTMRILHN